jgi:hypothetical protein
MADQWYYGKDGQQQGPVDEATIKSLLASGQLAPSDLVWKEGMANWAAASTLPEFANAAPPAPQYGQPQYGQPAAPQYGQPQYGQPQYGPPTGYPMGYGQGVDPSKQGKATTAMVLGIVSIVLCICPLIGLGCGIPAIIVGNGAKDAPNAGQAKAGVICGIVGIALSLLNAVVGVIMQLNKGGGGGF